MKRFNDYVAIYKEQLEKGDIQKAYAGLLRYMLSLKMYLSKRLSGIFSFGNASHGYMDYTYFPFFDDYLKDRKLRFGIVLNHKEIRFELWLMGQNMEVKRKYWDILKSTKWNENRVTKPKYSVLEVVLVENPNFNRLDILTLEIEKEAVRLSEEIISYLKKYQA